MYPLVDVEKPNVFRNLFHYDEIPKIAFNDRIVPVSYTHLDVYKRQEVQSRIASLSDGIEKNKSDIIELLNSRASTKAKIQKYDTMLEQIQVRKAQLNQRILEARKMCIRDRYKPQLCI